jgi:hypothetical protein
MGRYYHVWKTGEMHTGYWWGVLREGDYLEDLGIHTYIFIP